MCGGGAGVCGCVCVCGGGCVCVCVSNGVLELLRLSRYIILCYNIIIKCFLSLYLFSF